MLWENLLWQRLAMCPPRQFSLSDTTSFSLPPLPVANSSQLSVEIQTQVMNIPSRSESVNDLAVLADLGLEP
jgi:hypothetical protein